jgi:hypothetical protein
MSVDKGCTPNKWRCTCIEWGVHISVAYINPTFRITHLRLLHSISVGPALFRSNTVATTSFPVASERLGKRTSLVWLGLRRVDRNRDTECKTGKDCRRIFKYISCQGLCRLWRTMSVCVELGPGLLRWLKRYSHGLAYMAATPARKSLANALPPVADAEYGPYAATI